MGQTSKYIQSNHPDFWDNMVQLGINTTQLTNIIDEYLKFRSRRNTTDIQKIVILYEDWFFDANGILPDIKWSRDTLKIKNFSDWANRSWKHKNPDREVPPDIPVKVFEILLNNDEYWCFPCKESGKRTTLPAVLENAATLYAAISIEKRKQKTVLNEKKNVKL